MEIDTLKASLKPKNHMQDSKIWQIHRGNAEGELCFAPKTKHARRQDDEKKFQFLNQAIFLLFIIEFLHDRTLQLKKVMIHLPMLYAAGLAFIFGKWHMGVSTPW